MDGRGRGRGTELRRRKEERVGPRIECQGACAALLLNRVDDGEAVWAHFPDDRERALAVRAECQSGPRVERRTVHAVADRQRRDDTPAPGIHHRHPSAARTGGWRWASSTTSSAVFSMFTKI